MIDKLKTVSKALGAAAGGGAGGTAAAAVGAVALLPEGSPTWAYVVVIAVGLLAGAIPAGLGAYAAKPNALAQPGAV